MTFQPPLALPVLLYSQAETGFPRGFLRHKDGKSLWNKIKSVLFLSPNPAWHSSDVWLPWVIRTSPSLAQLPKGVLQLPGVSWNSVELFSWLAILRRAACTWKCYVLEQDLKITSVESCAVPPLLFQTEVCQALRNKYHFLIYFIRASFDVPLYAL